MVSYDSSESLRTSRTCPIKAIVNPANAPPSSTKIAAVVRYSHKLGSCASFGLSFSVEKRSVEAWNGAAWTSADCPSVRVMSFDMPSTSGRRARY